MNQLCLGYWSLTFFDQIYIWIVTQIFDWYTIHGIIFVLWCFSNSLPYGFITKKDHRPFGENLPGNEHVLSQGAFEDNFPLPRLVGYGQNSRVFPPGKPDNFSTPQIGSGRVHFGSMGILSGAAAGDVWRDVICFVHFLHLKSITSKKHHPFGEYPPWN